ncbi:MAG: MlaE family lipid ABC transporter permease subunit [Sulfuritalea sp.]|jgi:phospholipid/cholesterol/gamma-HCH transport system permease protein|nr:MlaE family lipid ABC transporter permease subunit [Sulfuritalea sp.]MBK8762316.1 MlaE family lipid ABC transporter permease subunit [Sulfuritalea sp.]MBP8119670.1 MlaE family lipid ABC transporter permease subunit [Burkholderiales bacterium]MCM2287795.1 MlaE family lipid ABC transporter permease subunit [Sulfuritalea sp.]
MTDEQIAQLVIGSESVSATAAVEVRCAGAWTVQGIARLERRLEVFSWPDEGDLAIDGSAISALDTAGAWLLHRTMRALEQRGRNVRMNGLRPEFSALLQLIASRPVTPESTAPARAGLLTNIGQQTWRGLIGMSGMLSFIGESTLILLRSLVQPRSIRWRPILHNIQTAGFEALPIVGLLTFLMGVVIAYQGADQLQRFGANIFIADLVGLSMVRELSPLLTAIIVAGRSGSAYAAQIGTMKITEEIDALRTIGVGPTELLVLPKMLALIIALPLLTLYADVTGVLGGMLMARSKLDVSFDVFLDRLGEAVSLSSFLTGIGKAPVFAAIIALVGCYRGFQVSGSADSVGRQTTVSVVQSIFLVILADALFSVAFNWLKI